jgi:transposase-like protein
LTGGPPLVSLEEARENSSGGRSDGPRKDTLLGVLRQAGLEGDVDFLRQGLQALMEALMELEVEERVGAGRYQRSPARRNWRNGWRRRGLSRRVGELLLSIPKLRRGSYFPSLLEPRRRAERALLSVVQEAYVML